jgi:protein Tob/BTG
MKHEIDIAVDFLMKVVSQNQNSRFLAPGQLAILHKKMCEVLKVKYLNHWFPDYPSRGSGYRCIRINGILDPLVAQAGEASGLPYNLLRSLFPPELTLWVDPHEVAYRFGENGSVCTLLDSKHTLNHTSSISSSPFKGRSSPLEFFKQSPTSSPPVTPSRSPADHMMRSKKQGLLTQRYEFNNNAKNINQLYPLAAYMC